MIQSPERAQAEETPYAPSDFGYTQFTMKRLVDIDDDLLEQARTIAGTDTIKDTVNAALRRLVDDERVLRHIERLRGLGTLARAKVEEARRPRTELEPCGSERAAELG
jgi:Arc/MetJ family transcription regulator